MCNYLFYKTTPVPPLSSLSSIHLLFLPLFLSPSLSIPLSLSLSLLLYFCCCLSLLCPVDIDNYYINIHCIHQYSLINFNIILFEWKYCESSLIDALHICVYIYDWINLKWFLFGTQSSNLAVQTTSILFRLVTFVRPRWHYINKNVVRFFIAVLFFK